MPRTRRKTSPSGYLHLIMRGIGRQTLFECQQDYETYLTFLQKYSAETEVAVCAYCLMDNHVHLLVRDEHNHTSAMIQKIGICYSKYYNQKYDRCGHLFQDRFLSQIIEDEHHFFAAFRYILNNPANAGICPAADYAWNSFREFGRQNSYIDSAPFRCRIANKDELRKFVLVQETETDIMEYYGKRTDDWARERLRQTLQIDNGMLLQKLPLEERNEAIRKLKKAGLSIRQIARLTGIGRNIIAQA